MSTKQFVPPMQPEQMTLPVKLSVVELSTLSFVAMICTSAVEQVVANATDRDHRKIREAARKHPKLPPDRALIPCPAMTLEMFMSTPSLVIEVGALWVP